MSEADNRFERWANRVRRPWGQIAVAFLNLTAFMLFLNLGLWFGFGIFDRLWKPNIIESAYHGVFASEANRSAILPNLDKDSIQKLHRETWGIEYQYEAITQFRERPRQGTYVNVDRNGFRHIPNQGVWPPDPTHQNIFVFGGSTTFGYGVPDGDTVPAHLQKLMHHQGNQAIRIYNFGRGDYHSTPERLLFEKLLADGVIPTAVVFIDGLNDFVYHPLWIGDLIYTTRISQLFSGKKTISAAWRGAVEALPMTRLYRTILNLVPSTTAGDHQPYERFDTETVIGAVIERYERNRRLIQAAAREYDVQTLFVWQPIHLYKYDSTHHLFKNLARKQWLYQYNEPGYIEMARRNANYEQSKKLLWCADIQEDLKQPLYVDLTHYTSEMAGRVAECISKALRERLRSARQTENSGPVGSQ